MKIGKMIQIMLGVFLIGFTFYCGGDDSRPDGGGMGSLDDGTKTKDVLRVATGSKDHTTLVKAVKAAGLVDALANPGPFTVFAPVDSAFDALPSGVVSDLMDESNKGKLEDVLYHHVYIGVLDEEALKARSGQEVSMFAGGPVKIEVKDGKLMVDDATVIASVRASNGVVHVVDRVILSKQ